MNMLWIRRGLKAALVIGATTSALYLHAEEKTPAANDKLQAEYKEVRKDQFLKNLEEREKYYSTMAQEMGKQRKACAGENIDACKKAKDDTKIVREKFKENRKLNREKFEKSNDEYRKKLGKDAPTDVEKKHKKMTQERKEAEDSEKE
jgi:hypothetical protein